HHGVPGVVAALVPHHPLDVAAEQIGGLPLALVAPLGADQHDRRHRLLSYAVSVASAWRRLPGVHPSRSAATSDKLRRTGRPRPRGDGPAGTDTMATVLLRCGQAPVPVTLSGEDFVAVS